MTAPAEAIKTLTELYSKEVLTRATRNMVLFGRRCRPEIEETFLGFELKFGKRRIVCPDQVTARYARVFAELGMAAIRIPYDPSLTSKILPKLEHSMEEIRSATSAAREGGPASRLSAYRKIRAALRRSAEPAKRREKG